MTEKDQGQSNEPSQVVQPSQPQTKEPSKGFETKPSYRNDDTPVRRR